MYSVASGSEAERVGAFRQAMLTLRGGGFVFAATDGGGQRRVETIIAGRRVKLAAGPFVLARLAQAPILPVAAHWRGSRLEIATGPLILPAAEAQTAAAFGAWIEAHLALYPGDCGGFLPFLQASPLAEPGEQFVPKAPVADLPVLGQRD